MDSSALLYANFPKHETFFSFDFLDDLILICNCYIYWASIVSLLIPSLTEKKRGRRA